MATYETGQVIPMGLIPCRNPGCRAFAAMNLIHEAVTFPDAILANRYSGYKLRRMPCPSCGLEGETWEEHYDSKGELVGSVPGSADES